MYNRKTRWAAASSAIIAALAALFIWGMKTSGTERPEDTGTAEPGLLQRTYSDWRQQEIPFGLSSVYLAPWRSYMDTWDARRYLEGLGIMFNVKAPEADATAQLLADAGFTSARVEIGWGNVSYEDETKLRDIQGRNFEAQLKALKKHGIRPIILLNANAGLPVPLTQWEVKLKNPAKAGAREIFVDNTSGIAAHYTGLTAQAYQIMFPVITKADAKTGRLQLSAPLTKDLKAGPLKLTRMKYRPLSGTVFADGQPNPAAAETIEGWKKYVHTVTSFVKSALGTKNNTVDSGFDLEVWNEMTFGSQFLDINNYYNPPFAFSEFPSYTSGDRTQKGGELLLPLTIDLVNRGNSGLPGVRVISGFSNQRPWENGTELFPGQTGFSRHYYTGFTEADSFIRSDPKAVKQPRILNATGTEDPEGAVPFIPAHINAMPEKWFYGYKTEYVVRDLQPFPGPLSNHFRYANPGNGHQAEVWMTETNWWRWPFSAQLMKTAGVPENDPELHALMQNIGAKTTLRYSTFYSHKGVQTVNLYAAKGGDLNYGVISDSFFEELAGNGYELTESARRAAGPQIQALTRLAKIMKTGVPIENPRPLKVTRLKEPNERLVLSGDGTPEHPDVYQRDDFAVLPFQLTDHKFAVGYYVMTRDMTQAWQPSLRPLDPQRYAMPPQKFELTLENVAGKNARVSASDPLTNNEIPVQIIRSTENSLTVELTAADYPRFLMIEESAPGPVLSATRLEKRGEDTYFTFRSNVSGSAEIKWGAYPVRSASSFSEKYFENDMQVIAQDSRTVDLIDQLSLPAKAGIWRWSGTIVPKYSETYTFILQSDSCIQLHLGGLNIIDGCGKTVTTGSIALTAGEAYQLELVYKNDKNKPHNVTMYWASDSQTKEPVTAAGSANENKAVVDVVPDTDISVKLPGFRIGDAVQAVLGISGIEARFPLWNYDVRGVWWEKQG